MSDKPEIRVVDVAARARAIYGNNANLVFGRTLPEREWHFDIRLPNGTWVRLETDATATDVAENIVYYGGVPS